MRAALIHRCLLGVTPAAVLLAMTLNPVPSESASRQALSLHPENPRYFQLRGKPAVLITSGEHYGAVLNLDFDYVRYLDELKRSGMNLTRTFSGSYVEKPGAFKIENNTLAPAPGRFICPWKRSDTPGYAGGGNRLDLTQWDPAYFARLKDFIAQAGKRGVVVELVLFCPLYDDAIWSYSPFHPQNNVNGVGEVPRTEVLTMKHPRLVQVQEALVRKLADELKEYDNLYYEICNEPYFGGVTLEWQRHIAETLVQAEASLGPQQRHLIAQNIANGSAKVTDPMPAVSVFNFHYAAPPKAVGENRHLNRPIGFDETGFKGTGDLPYRTEGWDFMLAGGAVYSNLDYSFTTDHPDGTAPVKDPTPGGGGRVLRSQLRILKEFLEGFRFTRMAPDETVVKGGVPEKATARALSEPGKQYAIYVKGGTSAPLRLSIPPGRYRAEWIDTKNTKTGAVARTDVLRDHPGGEFTLESPPYTEDIALRILRR
jgi:hypothetical protein